MAIGLVIYFSYGTLSIADSAVRPTLRRLTRVVAVAFRTAPVSGAALFRHASRILLDLLSIPPARRVRIERIGRELRAGRRVALSTHVNADGDGCGSEAALARLLAQRGMSVRIVNPTPWPEMFEFLLGDDVRDQHRGRRRRARGTSTF